MTEPTVTTRLLPLLGAPTASGKSAAVLQLADLLLEQGVQIEIITADAMQVYQGMDIGTAKPDAAERARHPHHLLDLVTPAAAFSVAAWTREAERVIGEVLQRGNLPVVAGGTGFYLRALASGLPTVPAADSGVQRGLWERLERVGLDVLVDELAQAAPLDAVRAQRNPRRVIRSLEVLERTGRPPSSFANTPPAFAYSKVVLLPPLSSLEPRIRQHTQQMFAAGLVDEVAALLEAFPQQLTATQAIGYKEVVAHLQGGTTVEGARGAVERATLRYAKRQLTWFRREPAVKYGLLAHEVQPELLAWLRSLL
jgi:tRNA dimethylallyltransferase